MSQVHLWHPDLIQLLLPPIHPKICLCHTLEFRKMMLRSRLRDWSRSRIDCIWARSSSFSSGLFTSFGGSLSLLDFGLLLDQQSVQLQSLRQDDVSNGAASNSELVELNWVFIYIWGGIPLMVILTFCRKVFILISTPLTDPTTIVPFFSSMVTV